MFIQWPIGIGGSSGAAFFSVGGPPCPPSGLSTWPIAINRSCGQRGFRYETIKMPLIGRIARGLNSSAPHHPAPITLQPLSPLPSPLARYKLLRADFLLLLVLNEFHANRENTTSDTRLDSSLCSRQTNARLL